MLPAPPPPPALDAFTNPSAGVRAEHRDLAHAQTRANLRVLAAELRRRGALRRGVSEHHAADVMYAIATDEGIFLRLTGECGWSPDRYADLIARTLTAKLAPS